MNFRAMKTLIQRELREHRALLWAPAITAAVIILTAMLSTTISGGFELDIDIESGGREFLVDVAHRQALFAVWMGALVLPQMLVAMIVIFFYLLDALYTERKDRSILFWKSMPVSDIETVASKLLTALLVVPLAVWVLSMFTGLVVFFVAGIKLAGTTLDPLTEFHAVTWLGLQLTTLQNTLVAALWYAPLACYLLLISVYAKRSPFLWAVLPPLLLVIFENAAFNTGKVASFLIDRLTAFFREVSVGPSTGDSAGGSASLYADVARAYDQLGTLDMLARADLWLGVAAAALLFWLAARLRRWRDDA